MTNPHLNQFTHNEKFLVCVCDNFSNEYYDWKVTITFYAATHLIRGYATEKGTVLNDRHDDVFSYMEQEFGKGSNEFKSFRTIFNNCIHVRYNGFTGRKSTAEQFWKNKYIESRARMDFIKKAFLRDADFSLTEYEEVDEEIFRIRNAGT